MAENLLANAGDSGDVNWIPGSGRSPGEGSGNPLQYSRLEKLMDSAAWGATVHGVQRVGHNLVTEHTHTRYHFVIQLHYTKIFLKYMNKIYSEFMKK